MRRSAWYISMKFWETRMKFCNLLIISCYRIQKLVKVFERDDIENIGRVFQKAALPMFNLQREREAHKESGAWLNALLVSSLRTLLDPESFRVAIALRVSGDVCIPHSSAAVGGWTVGVCTACPANTVLAAFHGIHQWMMWLRERF